MEAKIDELRHMSNDNNFNIAEELQKLKEKSASLTKTIFSSLTPWQITQMARHPQRPYTLDYNNRFITNFEELHGDRTYADDAALVTGIGLLDGRSVAIIGHQKGRNTKEKITRNFGMPKPEGYRKALRIMKMAERFGLSVVTFIDTPGAYPGIDAEERGQSEAIAKNLFEMAQLKTPIISTVIGEGGSGGALAVGVADHTMMLEYSIYSVISPEGCASILWKSAEKISDAAATLGLTSARLKSLGLVDQIITEPLGGAHRDIDCIATRIKDALDTKLTELESLPVDELIERRQKRLLNYGEFEG